jgi:antitoxin PrlF
LPVRDALRLRPGDELVYAIEGDRVWICKAREPSDDPFAAFGEWSSEADRRGYAGL